MPPFDPSSTLSEMISGLDISPSDFKLARDRYRAVADWLQGGRYLSGDSIDVYLQGSFRLGTVIRPYRNSKDSDYDVDQVCEINGRRPPPGILKNDVGDRMKSNGTYQQMLDDEGRRCWTLIYAGQEGRPGFHLDILPAALLGTGGSKIRITHKSNGAYSWRTSNPNGYYQWFKSINVFGEQLIVEQKEELFSNNRRLYETQEDVPTQLLRTPLQRAVQILKRHRDVHFNDRDFSPISIIITTICAHRYQNDNVFETLQEFVGYIQGRLAAVHNLRTLNVDGVLDYIGGKWIIKNPADYDENFADRWVEDPEYSEAFFAWVYKLGRDLRGFSQSASGRDLNLAVSIAVDAPESRAVNLTESLTAGDVSSDQAFLDLIHYGCEGEVAWSDVIDVAHRNVEGEVEYSEAKDIAWINYYQVLIHSGRGLERNQVWHIRQLLEKYIGKADFVYCCNLLLGSANLSMLRDCIRLRGGDVLDWPITRLAKGQIPEENALVIPYLNIQRS